MRPACAALRRVRHCCGQERAPRTVGHEAVHHGGTGAAVCAGCTDHQDNGSFFHRPELDCIMQLTINYGNDARHTHTRCCASKPTTVVFAALAVSHWIENQTDWSIKKFVRTIRRYRIVQIRAGQHTLTAAYPLPDALSQALATINAPDAAL
jgi:hypothetical protein